MRDELNDAFGSGLTPHIVDHNVDIAGLVELVEGEHPVRAEPREFLEPLGIAAGADDLASANRLATCIAMRPALPVAPRISTLDPRLKWMRWRNATQDDITGLIAAATVTGSASLGSATLRSFSTIVR